MLSWLARSINVVGNLPCIVCYNVSSWDKVRSAHRPVALIDDSKLVLERSPITTIKSHRMCFRTNG